MPVSEIVKYQLSSNKKCTVGLATRNQGYYYKKELVLRTNPTVLVLGSSRVMEFKKEFFSLPMTNAGGAMGSVNEGFSFIKEILEVQKPEIVILGLDGWWFNEDIIPPAEAVKPPLPMSHHISLRTYIQPYVWLWERKISLQEYFNKLNPINLIRNDLDEGIGVDGNLKKNGFSQDGSYIYNKIVSGKEKAKDQNFKFSIFRIQENNVRLGTNKNVNQVHFNNFLKMYHYIESKNVKIVVFIPPMAPEVIKHMKDFSLINDLRTKLKAANIPFYDFHNPGNISATNCEFIDGTHGGDIVYAKILAHMSSQNKVLSSYVNSKYLFAVTKHLKNITKIPESDITKDPEIDFLHIGCDKSNQYAVNMLDIDAS